MDIQSLCKHTFAYFYEKVYRTPCPAATIDSTRTKESIEKFALILWNRYKRNMGANYIYDYVLYQWGRYYEKIVSGNIGGPSGKLTPIMVFGQKPFDVYDGRRVEMDFMLQSSPLITELKCSKAELSFKKGIKFETEKIKVVKGTRDLTKAVAVQGEDPLSLCRDMTDLIDENDPACQKCPMKIECKELLKRQYPQIYRRKYE